MSQILNSQAVIERAGRGHDRARRAPRTSSAVAAGGGGAGASGADVVTSVVGVGSGSRAMPPEGVGASDGTVREP